MQMFIYSSILLPVIEVLIRVATSSAFHSFCHRLDLLVSTSLPHLSTIPLLEFNTLAYLEVSEAYAVHQPKINP
jgi:hypothetical protein